MVAALAVFPEKREVEHELSILNILRAFSHISHVLYDVVKGGSPQSKISRTSRSVSLQYRPLRCKFGIISLQSEQSASQRHLLRASLQHPSEEGLGRIACSSCSLAG